MTIAFNHRFNLEPGQGEALINQVYQAVTLDDVQDHIDSLIDYDRTYSGREAIDCDAFNNVSVLRLSLREELFPQLRDVIDANTGRVVTKGEQFHNIITSPPFLKRRARGVHLTDQIEIPFAIWLQVVQSLDQTRWMINPLECGHILNDSDAAIGVSRQGTIAVDFIGQNFGDGNQGITYELLRGHVDQLRGCRPVSTVLEPGTARSRRLTGDSSFR